MIEIRVSYNFPSWSRGFEPRLPLHVFNKLRTDGNYQSRYIELRASRIAFLLPAIPLASRASRCRWFRSNRN